MPGGKKTVRVLAESLWHYAHKKHLFDQIQIAKKVRELSPKRGFSHSTISDIEDGQPVLWTTAKRIADALGVTVDDIIHPVPALQPNSSRPDAIEPSAEFPPITTLVSSRMLPSTEGTLIGREKELSVLDQAWTDPKCHIIVFVAWGGVGKSALVNTWRARMAAHAWRGAKLVFEWSFYRQGTEDGAASAASFFDTALRWFGDPNPDHGSDWQRGERLANLIQKSPTLLLLDGLEPLQFGPGPQCGSLRDLGMRALFDHLAQSLTGLCVVTTRYPIANLSPFHGHTVLSRELDALSDDAGATLLQSLVGPKTTWEHLCNASHDYDGHALSLNLLGTYVRDCWNGDLDRCLKLSELHLGDLRRKEVQLLNAPRGCRAEQILAAYDHALESRPQRDILRLIGLFDRIVTGREIDCLRAGPAISGLTDSLCDLSLESWRQHLATLRQARLLAPRDELNPESIDAHPLVREYFARCLREESPNAWKEAQRRLFHFWSQAADPSPMTLLAMFPLYTAIFHACHAGEYRAALQTYRSQILREDMFSTRKLGALGADFSVLYAFFHIPFTQIVEGLSSEECAFVLCQTGYCLRSQGRLAQSIDCFRAALRLEDSRHNWEAVARICGMISQIHLTAGLLREAIQAGEEAVNAAAQSGRPAHCLQLKTSLAYMKQQAARTDAESDFAASLELRPIVSSLEDAESVNAEKLSAFHYGDFLLATDKCREAISFLNSLFDSGNRDRQSSPLAKGLVHSVLGRAYSQAWMQTQDTQDAIFAEQNLHLAVDELRQADREDCLPIVLLARSRHWLKINRLTESWMDLEEANRVIQRAALRLYEADAAIVSTHYWLSMMKTHTKSSSLQNAEDAFQRARQLVAEMNYYSRGSELETLQTRIANPS